ncbi:MAG: Gfo/Idh/MocA family oxidoreductase [Dysgonamonadaceae bacterium]|jgi:predicted dehydrogenase|nr:Gfo/Idh/MocA family oxidoreductase [Dysgonamonadaceae bacterium]MDD3310209.1 Gfo/Idh/MocA family oxidoreductase [Dysgonamonadaceae bacterium]MDD4399075.1 Gfo/Idh/MocA family oxidoreductase [Dysgonamonadaceae bacterium]
MSNKKPRQVDTSLRQFIKDLGYISGGAALLATTPWLQSFTPDKAKEIKSEKARIGFIGTGSRGQYSIHAVLAIPHAEIVALCDNYAPNLKTASALCPKAKTYTDYRKMLESPDIDGVIISTPLYLHAPMTLDALAAGKHVYCEKAMALTMDQCKSVYDAYQNTDKVLYFCMQRMFDEKYIKGMQMIHSGLIGDIVGERCHWFRNHDWRRPVPSQDLERHINWRLYWESSAGLMTELASHQLEVCCWAMQKVPESVIGVGDIVYWKDGREVYDSVNLVYHYNNGVKINYESLISNKYNGMEDQILGNKGSMNLATGNYYLENEESSKRSGIEQLIDNIGNKIYASVPAAGPSWRPETKEKYVPYNILEGNFNVNDGLSMIGALKDGSDEILSSFCQACITGEKGKNIVEEAYSATMLCLLGNQAMSEQRKITFPEEYKIPYMKFS